jgi:hypothetical protein
MSIRFSLNAPALACAVSLCAVAPAWAQSLTPKDAWEALNAFVDGAGGRLTATGMVREGEAMVARNVTLGSGDGAGSLEFSFDQIRLEPRGDRMALIPSASFQAVSTIGAPGERRVYAITHDGEMVLSLTEAAMGLALDFGSLQITKTEARRQGRTLDEGFQMRLTGLAGQTDLTLEAPFNLQGRITAAAMGYDMRLRETDFIQIEQDGTSETRDLVLEFGANGLGLMTDGPGFMRRAFDGGFSAQARLDSGVTESTVRQVIGSQRVDFTLSAETSTATLGLSDGNFLVEAGSQALNVVMGGNFPGTVSAARLAFGFGMPIVATDTDRPFTLSTILSEVRIGRDLLAMLGAGDFSEDAITLETELSAQGRWLVEITDNPPDDVQPADFSSVSLTNLLTQVGAAMLTGSGSYAFAPGAIAAAGDGLPDGEGRFQFELRGGEALLNRLGAIGLIPPDQQFLARMMMNGLGRSIGPDHLQSDLVIGRGGAVTVNGMPLPF